jgi:transposase-like protein
MIQYTEEEKILLLREYVESGKSMHAFSKEKGIPRGTMSCWYSHYGFPDSKTISEYMRKKNIPDDVRSLQEEIVRLRKEKELDAKRFQKALNEEKLKNLANETMIDMAEKIYHIRIRKNSDAK